MKDDIKDISTNRFRKRMNVGRAIRRIDRKMRKRVKITPLKKGGKKC